MKKVLSIVLLAALLATMVIVPVSAQGVAPAAIPQPPRDDVLILFDGSMDNLILQHPTTQQAELLEDEDNYVQGDRSLLVDMPDSGIQWIVNFALMLKITNDEPVSITEYPISELSVYNSVTTKKGDVIQINYVDPDNKAGAGDDSYNKNHVIEDKEPGWHLLRHNIAETALWGGDTLNPDNIGHMRISWTTDVDNYEEIDWNFDCLLIAKQSFFDDRAAAETEMIGIIDTLETPTADNFDAVKDSILSAKTKLDGYLNEFPNFMVESQDKVIKMDQIWNAYQNIQAQAAADVIIGKINALGEITLANHTDKMTEIEAIDAEISAYTSAGYSKNLITNTDVLDAAKATCARFVVEAKIDALPTVDTVKIEDETAVNEVKTALNALSADQQAAIEQAKKDKIDALLEQIEKLKHPYTLGNINDDESIDAADALMALQHSVKLITLNETQFLAANVDGNEVVDASDALMILQCSVDLIKPEDFPAAKK